MAGRGPAPEDRAADGGSFDVLPAEGYAGKVPKLGAGYRVSDGHHERRVRFLAATRDWYADWSTSPQASRFTATDWRRLRMIAPLVDRYLRSSAKDLAAEIRLQEALLGATAADRLRLRWKVAEPVAPLEGESPRAARRQRLRSVA